MKIDVLDIGFDDVSLEQAVSFAYDLIREKKKSYVVTPNPEIVWNCRKNEALREAVNNAALVLPDGIGIILAGRLLKRPFSGGRVTGIDFITELFRKLAEAGCSVFLLGAKPGVADEAGTRLAAGFPGLRIAGTMNGYFTDPEPVIEMIRKASPDLLLVCLGSPAQELWMNEYVKTLDVPLCAGLGGVLDVFAGSVKRAPDIFIRLGLEWFYRIIREPRRAKRALKLPMFIFAVLWRRIRGK